MVNQSFRAAFWALIVAFALSVCALCSDPEEVRIALLAPSSRPAPGIDDGSDVRLLAAREPHPTRVPAAETWDGDRLATARRDDAVSDSPWLTDAEPRSPARTTPFAVLEPPVREASSASHSELPWLVTSSTPAGLNDRFEELPPPPVFVEPASAEQPPMAAAQLDELIPRIEGPRGDMESLRNTQESVQQTLGNLAAANEAGAPPDVLLQVWVLDVPHSGEFQGGFVTALERARGLPTIRGAAGDAHVSFAWSETEGTEFWRWLQRQEPVEEIDARAMQLPPRAVSEVLVPGRQQRPRIEQARGTEVTPPPLRDDPGVRFEFRAASTSPHVIEVEFRPSTAPGDRWLRAAVPVDAVLVIEAPADRSPGIVGNHAGAHRSTRSAVVVVQPSLARSLIEPPSLPELDSLLIP